MIDAIEQAAPPETERSGYLVHLDNFEGPLDLLLHLIEEDEIEIWEVSIARMTEQYVDYLQKMEALNVEIAGDFLVMAATLMRLKSRALLPRPVWSDADADQPQTEEELIERLIKYKTYKEVAAALQRLQEQTGPRFPRGLMAVLPADYEYPLEEIDLFALVEALHSVRARTQQRDEVLHQVHLDDVRLEDQVRLLLAKLDQGHGRIAFGELFASGARPLERAVTFFASLELARQQVVLLMQDQPFDELWILSRVSEAAALP